MSVMLRSIAMRGNREDIADLLEMQNIEVERFKLELQCQIKRTNDAEDVLREIANEDYRGNRSSASMRAIAFLEKLTD